MIGTIEVVGVLADKTSIGKYQPFTFIAGINLNKVGYFIVLSFLATWVLSVVIWKTGKYEERYSSGIVETDHVHQAIEIVD